MRSTVCQNPATSCSVLALSRTAAGTLLVLTWIAMRSSHIDLDRPVTLSWVAVGPLSLSWIAVGPRTSSWIAVGPFALSRIAVGRLSLSRIAVGPLTLFWRAVGRLSLSRIAIGPLTLSWIAQCRTSRFIPDSCRIPLLALSW